jgi:hypothetical protein
VHARSTLASGTYVRLHDGPRNTVDDFPGLEYVRTTTSTPFQSPYATVIQVGLYNERWTAMATFAKALERYHDDLPSNTEFHVNDQNGCKLDTILDPCDEQTEYCCDCGPNQNYSNDVGANESYIRMHSKDCNGTNLRSKFVTAHEYGHAYGSQVANKAIQDPLNPLHNVEPDNCGFGNPGYDNDTKEWSSLAFHEGFAHWVSARVWNDRLTDGQFRWETSFDLLRCDACPNPRGYLKNFCCVAATQGCADSLFGTGTIQDWMRGFWQLHAHSCDDAPTRAGVAELYGNILNYPAGLYDYSFFSLTTLEVPTLFPDCDYAWETIGCENSLDELGTIQSGSCN